MRTSILFLLSFLMTSVGFSQFKFPEKEKAIEFKKRILIVELKEENPKRIQKLSDTPDKLEAYRKYISNYNEMLKRYINNEYWTLNDKIEYKTTGEVNFLASQKNKQYSLLSFTPSKKRQQTHNNVITEYEVFTAVGYLMEDAKKRESYNLTDEVFSVSFPHDYLSPVDLIFLQEQFTRYINAAEQRQICL